MTSWYVTWSINAIIGIIVIGACVLDLTHNPLHHPRKFVNFRFVNWLLVGLTYAGTYFGRYNINVTNTQQIWTLVGVDNATYSTIITVGFVAYAVFVVLNGFVVDKWGGRKATIIGSLASGCCNILMGIVAWGISHNWWAKGVHNVIIICVLYAINNYFQTYCTSAICKVGVNWYNLRERGVFSSIFGVIIAFGFYLALNVNGLILEAMDWSFVFFIPAAMLITLSGICVFVIRSTPLEAGYPPVDDDARAEWERLRAEHHDTSAAGENKEIAASIQHGMPFLQLFKHVFLNKLFILFCLIDLCVGWCRDGVLSWMPSFFHDGYHMDTHGDIYAIASAGITLGGMFGSLSAGTASDLLFHSRRPPVALIALLGFAVTITGVFFVYQYGGVDLAWLAAVGIGISSLFFSSVHGIITSTCAMDFAGSKATGTAVGLLDGVQKVGSSLTGTLMGLIVGSTPPLRFGWWLLSMLPAAIIGSLLVLPILNKRAPQRYQPVASKVEDGAINEEKKEGEERKPLLATPGK